jgi:predicted  nucleic acid-binding Zn-ribbon protein
MKHNKMIDKLENICYNTKTRKRVLKMNNVRRKELSKIEERLSTIKDALNDIKSDLEYVLTDEEDGLSNMESFSGTDRYAAMEEAVNNMSDAASALEEAVDNIDSAMESISNAQN